MGDVRIVRHRIVHNKSYIDENYEKMKVLDWPLAEGSELKLSDEKFSDLIHKLT
jgi:hypothetical protein